MYSETEKKDENDGNDYTYFKDEKIEIPDDGNSKFSFRKLWAFTGPGFLMSVIFLEPGNIESDLQSGTIARYKLLWVLLSSIGMGLMMQRLSARLGVVTGLNLAEMCNRQFKRFPKFLLWIMIEIAIIASDMQEVIGTAIAIYLLTNKFVPLWVGVIITIFDTFTFLFLDKYGLRKLEFIFACFIAVVAVSFTYEYSVASPPTGEILKGMFIPWCENCNTAVLMQAVGIIGTNISPHNLYLYGALVNSRVIDRNQPKKVREANMYYFTEAAVALLLSLLINVCIMAIFAQGLYNKSNAEVYEICRTNNFTYGLEEFTSNDEIFKADLYQGGVFLGCQYGYVAMIIWAIGILAAGQSATMTGTYAGQFVMEGFLNLQWPRWRRVLLTRSLAIAPAFTVAFFSNINQLTGMNDILNVIMSLQLPFAALPLIAFTSCVNIMGEFENGLFNKVVTTGLSILVIGLNGFLVVQTISESSDLVNSTFAISIICILALFYLAFCIYLLIYLAIAFGGSFLNDFSLIDKFITGPIAGKLELKYLREKR